MQLYIIANDLHDIDIVLSHMDIYRSISAMFFWSCFIICHIACCFELEGMIFPVAVMVTAGSIQGGSAPDKKR